MGKKKQSELKNWVPLHGHGFQNGLVRETNTGREGERTTYQLDPFYDAKNQAYIYKYRKDAKSPLVASYGSEKATFDNVKHMFAHEIKGKDDKERKKSEKELKKRVYMTTITEHIPKRLAEVPQLTFGESLYVLDRSLEGYETAYNKCGPMYVNDKMIGFTPEGYAKVWVNEDFANNHPQFKRKTLDSTLDNSKEFLEGYYDKRPLNGSDEIDMVENIIDVVADHTEDGRYPEPFRSQIHQRSLNFRDARRLIKEHALNNHIFVPDRVDIWGNRCWGWGRTTTHVNNTYIPRPPPVTTVQRPEPVHGYRFNYIPPNEPYHPDIFASRMGEHGYHHGVKY